MLGNMSSYLQRLFGWFSLLEHCLFWSVTPAGGDSDKPRVRIMAIGVTGALEQPQSTCS